MTVLEVIQRSTEFLQKKGVDSPRLQAELLLAHKLSVPRMRLYLDFERRLQPEELEAVRQMVKRRGQREPLQQIVGSTSFCGLEIFVNRNVLVPRPETELLAEAGWTFAREQARSEGSAPKVLDVGVGSGCLAIAIAANCPAALVTAIDISTEALQLAQSNAERAGVQDRITFVRSDALAEVPCERQFSLVVSNPPYIPTGDLETLQAEIRQYEPRQALDGGQDGLDFYRLLAAGTGSRLRPSGALMVEFGDGQERALEKLFEDENWVVEKILEDYTRRPRIMIARLHAEKKRHPKA